MVIGLGMGVAVGIGVPLGRGLGMGVPVEIAATVETIGVGKGGEATGAVALQPASMTSKSTIKAKCFMWDFFLTL
jgi:hypothetical protein